MSTDAGGSAAPWLILPTLNEVDNLPPLVEGIRRLGSRLRVLVVDDASSDGTAEVADALAEGRADLAVLRREGERGYGRALAAGFGRALALGATAIVTMDCDLSHDPAALPELLRALEAADIVIGSRYVPGGRIRDWSVHRRLLSLAANRFVRTLFGLDVHDCTSGFRAYRRAALTGIPWERLHSTGYSFLVEVLIWAKRQRRLRLRETPICFVDRRHGTSKMGAAQILGGAANLIALRLELWRHPAGAGPTPGHGDR